MAHASSLFQLLPNTVQTIWLLEAGLEVDRGLKINYRCPFVFVSRRAIENTGLRGLGPWLLSLLMGFWPRQHISTSSQVSSECCQISRSHCNTSAGRWIFVPKNDSPEKPLWLCSHPKGGCWHPVVKVEGDAGDALFQWEPSVASRKTWGGWWKVPAASMANLLQGRHVGCLDNAMMKTARPLHKQRNMSRDLRPHAWMHGWSKGLPASWFQGFPSLCPLRWCGCRHTLLPLALFGRAGGSTPAQQAH